MTSSGPRAFIGISGWRYRSWRGRFYPPGLPQRRELEYAAERMTSVELNGSFYSLQRPSSYQRWRAEVPEDFVFAVKGSRYITHMLKLRNVDTALANFLASGVLALGPALGPMLWQLPERLQFHPEILEPFLAALPRSTTAAAELAVAHDARLKGRAHVEVEADLPLRHALEVRSPTFETPELVELLRRQDVALVVADTAGKWPLLKDVTSDFVYVRLHGAEELYVSGYTDEQLERWAADVRGWMTGASTPDGVGRDVYVYFDNDVKVHAPFDAIRLLELVTTS
ncbi:DUF72 domain-containing protein [Lysobacter korlensis]|uniref:DUF72 domain-containing protein n=1 Tax=Lysobacter korlensis TaxID=553636 RepID=A0ABV6RQP7_9GAMM